MKALFAIILIAASVSANAAYTVVGWQTDASGFNSTYTRFVNEAVATKAACLNAANQEINILHTLDVRTNNAHIYQIFCVNDGSNTPASTAGGITGGVGNQLQYLQ